MDLPSGLTSTVSQVKTFIFNAVTCLRLIIHLQLRSRVLRLARFTLLTMEMARTKGCPSIFLSRSLRHALNLQPSIRQTPRYKREIHVSKPRSEQQKSFKGQLFESTTQRLARERAEQQRFAKERGESHSGRNFATTFGLFYG